jgi:hypothetical protein
MVQAARAWNLGTLRNGYKTKSVTISEFLQD